MTTIWGKVTIDLLCDDCGNNFTVVGKANVKVLSAMVRRGEYVRCPFCQKKEDRRRMILELMLKKDCEYKLCK